MGSFGLKPALYDEDKYMIKRAEKYRLETGAYLKLKFRKHCFFRNSMNFKMFTACWLELALACWLRASLA